MKRKWLVLSALGAALLLLSGAFPAAAQTFISYVVQPGDRLARIAQRYCTTWQEIYSLNVATIGPNPNLIRAGAVLTVPNRCGLGGVYDRGNMHRANGYVVGNVYYVARGDWLSAIARRFGVTTWAIAQANALYDPNRIEVGQGLVIPGLGGIFPPPPPNPTYQPPPPPPPLYTCILTALTGFPIYQTPDLNALLVGYLSPGQQGVVRNRTFDASGFQWYQIEFANVTGWLTAQPMMVSVTGSGCP
jgi:LysM repeat protein